MTKSDVIDGAGGRNRDTASGEEGEEDVWKKKTQTFN